MAPIVIISDYGEGAGVAAVKGVCREYAPQSRIFDLTHDIAPLDAEAAGKVLSSSMAAWPQGTMFLNLVDNGEKGRKYAVLFTADGYAIASPDNAALALLAKEHGAAKKQDITAAVAEYAARQASALCHGRDIAYAAACCAAGRL